MMIRSFKDTFINLLTEENISSGVFGPGDQGVNAIYNPNEGRFTSNDSIYAPGDSRKPGFIGTFKRKLSSSKIKRKRKRK